MKNYLQRASEINERINILSTYSDNTKSITRIFGTKAFVECSDKIASWMRDAGLETSIDNMGNVRGKWCSKNPDAKILVIGSHFDTVLNAGKFEGTLGILAGLDIVEHIISQNITLPFHLELIAFSGDAGIRFNYSFLGSEVVTGIFHDRLLEIKDAGGNTLSKVLHTLNYDPSKLSEDAISPENWLGYYEMHIEQGNLLVENNLPVCVVSSISGQKRIEIKFTGKSGHAGTVRMNLRKDALCAAAKFILFVEKYASREKGNLLATVGKISIERAASNVIPGIVNCSVDIRSNDSKILSEAYEMIYAECEKICDKKSRAT